MVISATFSLHSHALEKSMLNFDTVIIDDASMVSETECLAALRHGALRAILIGNPVLEQSMFLLNPSLGNRTLFSRSLNTIEIKAAEPVTVPLTVKTPAKGKASRRKTPEKLQTVVTAPVPSVSI